jgi:hypothetical protein
VLVEGGVGDVGLDEDDGEVDHTDALGVGRRRNGQFDRRGVIDLALDPEPPIVQRVDVPLSNRNGPHPDHSEPGEPPSPTAPLR